MKSVIYLLLLLSCSLSFAQTIPLSKIVGDTAGVEGEKNVEILPGEVVVIDRSVNVGELKINGTLLCGENAEIKAKTIFVNGLFQCGSLTAPFSKKLFISLKPQATIPTAGAPLAAYRGLIVNNPGKLLLFGDQKRSGHFKLAGTVLAGAKSLKVAGTFSGWLPGDEIVLASTTYNPRESETRIISSISGSTVNFIEPLAYKHWGETENYSTQRGVVVLDQRAEIANLTRNIVIRADESTGAISDADIPGSQLGGHVMVMKGAFANVDSVEFYHMGQAGLMARYPFHWHFAGDVPGQFIKNSSIHRSYQRCVTVHQTNQALVENNVCYDFRGHGYFLEDGNEIDNVITKNLGINARLPLTSKILLASDNPYAALSGITGQRFMAVSTFWIAHPQNKVTYNIASGSDGTGFWMGYVRVARQFNKVTGEFDGALLARPQNSNTTEFSYNVAHSTLVGHTWDGAPFQEVYPAGENPFTMNNPNNPQDRKVRVSHYAPSQVPVFKGLVAYKNVQTGIYFRGQSAVYDGTILADNGNSLFLAYNQIVKNSLVVGKSKNNSKVEEDYLYAGNRFRAAQKGILLYDGPWELNNVDFVNFDEARTFTTLGTLTFEHTSAPLHAIGGSAKYTNISSKLKFSPEPYNRLYYDKFTSLSLWYDENQTNSARDKDGTLTGVVNGMLLPAHKFTNHPGCSVKNFPGKVSSFAGFVVCPSETDVASLTFHPGTTPSDKVPFVVKRSDNVVSMPKAEWGYLDAIGDTDQRMSNRKALMVINSNYTYQVLLKPSARSDGNGLNGLRMTLNAEKMGATLPAIKLIGLGSNCSIGAQKFDSLAALNSSLGDGYYSFENDFYVKLKTSAIFENVIPSVHGITTESVSPKFLISCAAPVISEIKGFLEPVQTINNVTVIKGWACDYGQSAEIAVHFYAGAPAGLGGSIIGSTKASLNSEEAVNFSCADASAVGHRFSYTVPDSALQKYAGQKIYVYGISSTGKSNLALGMSGSLVLPGVRTAKYSCSLNGATILHGASKTLFQSPMVAKGKTCVSEIRTCNDGVMSGSFASATCEVNTKDIAEARGAIEATPQGFIRGWACEMNNPTSINVEIYAGSPTAGGKLLKTVRAAEVNEAAVSSTCGTKGINHRFTLQLDEATMIQNQGKAIHVLAVPATTGKVKGIAFNSGNVLLQTHKIVGAIEGLTVANNEVLVSGWACDYARSKMIDVHVYVGGTYGVGKIVGTTKADKPSDDTKAAKCADPSKLYHGFQFRISASQVSSLKDQAIYVYGISTSGNGNLVITNSGVFKIP